MDGREVIRERLIDILNSKYKLDTAKKEDLYDLNLLGKKMRMVSSDLLCLFLDVEKEFNISISEEDVINGRFKTINKITDLIYEKTA